MTGINDPETYEAWYHTPRGTWIANTEYSLMLQLFRPLAGFSLLDVGCGTGHFSRRFVENGLQVTGLDPDQNAIDYAAGLNAPIQYINGSAELLPFSDESFDYCAAVTSLCFINKPEQALQEMWRVARRGVVLGLLNRHSLLYRKKHNSPGYAGARWDTWDDVLSWSKLLLPRPKHVAHQTAVFFPSGNVLTRMIERIIPGQIDFGGFLAIYIVKE